MPGGDRETAEDGQAHLRGVVGRERDHHRRDRREGGAGELEVPRFERRGRRRLDVTNDS